MTSVLSNNSQPQTKSTKSAAARRPVGRPRVQRGTDSPQAIVRQAVARLKDIRDSGQTDRFHRFAYGGSFEHLGQVPAERCLSVHEAGCKLGAIERLTGWPIERVLSDWDQLLSGWVSAIGQIVLTMGRTERARAVGEMMNSWCRLDEVLRSMAFTAWIKEGALGVPAPRGDALASMIGIHTRALQKCLERLRAERTQPTTEYEVQVDLWLGPPPADDPVPHLPVLWASVKDTLSGTKAAEQGLLPANTPAEAESARRLLRRRLSSLGNTTDSSSEKPTLPVYLTICRRCGRTMTFSDTPALCACRFEVKRTQSEPRAAKRKRRSRGDAP